MDNEWLLPAPLSAVSLDAPSSSTTVSLGKGDFHRHVPVAPVTATERGILVIASCALVSDALTNYLENSALVELAVEIEGEKAIEEFIDDARWAHNERRIGETLVQYNAVGGICVHPGMPTALPLRDATDRRLVGLMFRFMMVISLVIDAGLNFLLITPWKIEDVIDIRTHHSATRLRDYSSSGYDLDGICYQVVSNAAIHDSPNLYECIAKFFTEVSSHHVQAPRQVPLPADTMNEDDLIRQEVNQPLQLSSTSQGTSRRQENMKALGGMKNPRISLHRVPKHKDVGRDVAMIIDKFIQQRPHVQHCIFRAIGDKAKKNKGPSSSDLGDLRGEIEDYFGLVRTGRTDIGPRLYHKIYQRWVERAEDPDVHVPRWLDPQVGASLGLTKPTETCGVFPESHATTPDEDKRPLIVPGETFVNYSSIESSPYGQ